MAEDRLDKILKSKVDQHPSKMDVEAFWGALEPRLEKPKKRRRIFIWWLLPMVGLIAFAIWMLNHNGSNQTDIGDGLLTQQENINPSNKVEKISNSKESNSLILSENNNIQNDPSSQLQRNTKEIKSELESNNNVVNQKLDTRVNSGQTDLVNRDRINAKQNPNHLHNHALVNESKLFNNTSSNISSIDQRTTFKISNLSSLALNLNTQADVLDLSHRISMSELIEKNEESSSLPGVKGISVYGGAGMIQRELIDLGVDTLGSLLANRNGSETTLESLNAGFEFRWYHPSGLNLFGGLEYIRINERFVNSYTFDSIRFEEEYIIGNKTVNGVTSDLYGSASVLTVYQVDQTRYNAHNFIDLRLGMAYDKSFGKFGLGLSSSIQYNLRSWSSFTMFDEQKNLFTNGGDVQVFKNRNGLSLNLGATLRYQLSDSWNLWFSPEIHRRLKTVTTENYLLDQKYQLIRMKLGLEKRF